MNKYLFDPVIIFILMFYYCLVNRIINAGRLAKVIGQK